MNHRTTWGLAFCWGRDARIAGLPKDHVITEKEAIRAIRAIRDEARDFEFEDWEECDDENIRRNWLSGWLEANREIRVSETAIAIKKLRNNDLRNRARQLRVQRAKEKKERTA